MSKDTGGDAGYQNLWSFDNGAGGYSRGMGYAINDNDLVAQTKTSSPFTLASSSSANQVWGLSYAGNDPQSINAYNNGSTLAGPQNLATEVNNDGGLDIGYVFLTGGSPQNTQFFAGSISALLMWDRQLTSGERLEVETYLSNTYVVPEPTSIAFLATGGLAVAAVAAARRRRRFLLRASVVRGRGAPGCL